MDLSTVRARMLACATGAIVITQLSVPAAHAVAWQPRQASTNPAETLTPSAPDSAPPPESSASVTEPKPVPATRTRKARHVPAYPSRSKEQGKRIVYDKALMTIWLIDANDRVVARYPVVGRTDRPAVGTYHVYSKSPYSANREQKLTFKNMVRFARGPNTGAAIGFHDIPRTYDGRRIHGEDVLGLPLGRGGCVRMSDEASEAVYEFAPVGTLVEVVS